MPLLKSAFAARTLLFTVAGALALFAIVATSVWLSAQAARHSEEAPRLRTIRTLSAELLTALVDSETGQRGYLLTEDQRYLKPFELGRPLIDDNLKRLRGLIDPNSEDGARIGRLSLLIDVKVAELTETIQLALGGSRDAALALMRADQGRIVMDEIRGILGPLIVRSEQRVASLLTELNDAVRTLFYVSMAGGALVIAFATAVFVTVSRNTRELVKVREDLEILNSDLELRVAERTSDLSRANDEIQRFAYIVSHDLRAPLVNIMGFTSELEASLKTLHQYVTAPDDGVRDEGAKDGVLTAVNEDIPEAVRFIRASSSKMDGLINAILKLSREGWRELNAQIVDVGELLRIAAASLQHQLSEADAVIELPDRFPSMVTDRLALEQVMGNLLDNAVKYLAKGRPGHIAVTAAESRGRVDIAVTDNGRGIAEQIRSGSSNCSDAPERRTGRARVSAWRMSGRWCAAWGARLAYDPDLARGPHFE